MPFLERGAFLRTESDFYASARSAHIAILCRIRPRVIYLTGIISRSGRPVCILVFGRSAAIGRVFPCRPHGRASISNFIYRAGRVLASFRRIMTLDSCMQVEHT